MDAPSVDNLCNLLARSRLLTADEIRDVHQRWRKESGDLAADGATFLRWLVLHQYLTDYQAGLVLKGKVDRFFLGDYKLLDRIGAGRMAGVFQGLHRLGQMVAIKVLPPSKVKDPQAFGRFQREARLALRLRHPNVVRTFQVGEDEGLHYLVMEYLDGETLEETLKARGRLPAAEAATVVHQALAGLQYLNEQGIVHRDLKPANLMLLPGAEADSRAPLLSCTVKILDIGLGRALFDEGETAAEGAELTTQGALLGDPDYMAPEQARDAHSADIRADIYSLGCVLYHTLAGQPPYAGGNAVRKLVRHATEAPRPLQALAPGTPAALQHVVDGMIAKDPAQRFATPKEAARPLEELLTAREPRKRKAPADSAAYIQWLEAQERARPAADVPVAMPVQPAAAAGVPVAAPVQPAGAVNVEMVPVAAPPKKRKRFEVGNRDFVFLLVGIVGVVVALILGLLLARVLKPKASEENRRTSVRDAPPSLLWSWPERAQVGQSRESSVRVQPGRVPPCATSSTATTCSTPGGSRRARPGPGSSSAPGSTCSTACTGPAPRA